MGNPVQYLDDLIARLGSVNPATPRAHSGVVFDSRKGIGGVPDAANIDYRGFQAYLFPSQFRRLNQPRDLEVRPIDHIRSAIESGEPIGTPMLYVEKSPGGWTVRGHEGRGRMMAMEERDANALYPVAVHPYGEIRARHLTPEALFTKLLPDQYGDRATRPDLVVWQQRPYVRPGQEESPAVLRAIRELLPR